MKKQISLILFAWLLSGSAFSQSVQLLMSPKPSPYFADWASRSETARLIVNNTSGSPIDCKIKSQLFNGKSELIGETNLNKMPVLTLMPGISQFSAEDIYPIQALQFYGNNKMSIIQTGKIPDDNYTLCTILVNPKTGVSLNALPPQCRMFTIAAYQAPILISPRDNEEVLETNIRGMLFRWTSVVPTPNFIVTYKLQIWEVPDGMNGVTAIRTNKPIVDKDFRGQTQAQWPTDFALPEAGKKYVWAITPLDDQDRKMVDGIGISTPFEFNIDNINKLRSKSSPNSPSDTFGHNSLSKNFYPLFILPKDTGNKSSSQNPISYSIKIVEIIDEQSAIIALKSNHVLFEKKGITSTSFQYPENAPPLDSTKHYAWSVSSSEKKNNIGSFNRTKSGIRRIYYITQPSVIPTIVCKDHFNSATDIYTINTIVYGALNNNVISWLVISSNATLQPNTIVAGIPASIPDSFTSVNAAPITFIHPTSPSIVTLTYIFLYSNGDQYTTTIDVPYTKCDNCGISLCNLDFELPNIHTTLADGTLLSSFVDYLQTNQSNIPCWHTTAVDHKIEIWSAGMQITPYSGNQFAELNCDTIGSLNQTFTARRGACFTISFAHRGRTGRGTSGLPFDNKMVVSIGPVNGTKLVLPTYVGITTAWTVYSFTYTCQVAGTYILSFESLTDASTDEVGGNFIDAISVTCPCSAGPIIIHNNHL
jgi:hypothetical protein